MAESTLSAQYKDLTGDVGFFLGFGRGADNGESAWTAQQQSAIDRCVKGGLRNFYHCGYDWSFLKPMATLQLDSGAQTVPLPDDFAGVEGQIHITTLTGATQWWPLDFGPIGRVYQRYSEQPTTTGRPLVACEEPIKGTTGTAGQRFQLRIWPIADQAYTLKLQYYLNPDYLTGTFPYAYGGAQHAETMLESCLAVAEKILDDAATVHAMEFEKRLAVSKDIDSRGKPTNLGYNGDRSDLQFRNWNQLSPWWHFGDSIRVNGQLY